MKKNYTEEKFQIETRYGNINCLLLKPKNNVYSKEDTVGVLWIHGGGYIFGKKEVIYTARGLDFVNIFSCVVLTFDYTLARKSPYPRALLESYDVLCYFLDHADEFGFNKDKIIVAGKSAGGGLAIALSMYVLDNTDIKISYQIPLYPMIDCYDTETNRNNSSVYWNSKLNKKSWEIYLRDIEGEIPPYASPSRRKDYSNLPPCYTFVGKKELFYSETKEYIDNLTKAKVDASFDVYDINVHAFDMTRKRKKISKLAISNFRDKVKQILEDIRKKTP